MGGKSASSMNSYYGTAAGIISLGPIDFIWGVMVNNTLQYPPSVKVWDTHSWKPGNKVLFTDGNAYKALAATNVDPPNFPWQLYATPYVTGTYAAKAIVLQGSNIWQNGDDPNPLAPPTVLPPNPVSGASSDNWFPTHGNGWTYLYTLAPWTSDGNWAANSIVAWEGRLYTNSAGTSAEPPAAPWSLWKLDRAGSPNPLKMTVPNMGDMYLYWGTADQTLDAVGEASLAALGHPPYRYRSVFVLKNFLFGTETTTAPDVTVLGGRIPSQGIIVGASCNLDAEWQANPWCVLAEILTNQIWGLGLPVGWFDQATWQAEADRCAANPALYYISPTYTSLMKVRDLVSDLLGYPDAFVFWSAVATLIAGHWPHGEAAPAFNATNSVNRDNLVEEIQWDGKGWGSTCNSTELSYRDVQAAFKSRTALAPNLFNRAITKRLLSEKVDRPHIVRTAQALAWATEHAKITGDLQNAGTCKIREATASAVRPGSLFLLTDDVLSTSSVQRCTRRTIAAPPEGTVTLQHETERGVSPAPYAPTSTNPFPSPGTTPQPVTQFQFVQLPFGLSGSPNSLACLAARSDIITTLAQIWFKQADANAYQQLGTLRGFAVAGSVGLMAHTDVLGPLNQGDVGSLSHSNVWQVTVQFTAPNGGSIWYAAASGVDYVPDYVHGTVTVVPGGNIPNGSALRVNYAYGIELNTAPNTPPADLEKISASLTADEVADNTLLLFLFQQANPALCEIVSVSAVQALGEGAYAVGGTMQQFGTLSGGDGTHQWTIGDFGFLVLRADILPLIHSSFPSLQQANAVADFVIAPGNPWGQADITDLYSIGNPKGLSTSCRYTFNNIYAPTVQWISLVVDGEVISDFTSPFSANAVFGFSFEADDRNGDLAHGAMVAVQGDTEITLWASNFPASGRQHATVQFSLPVGTWQIMLRLTDLAGNQSVNPVSFPLVSGGGGGGPIPVVPVGPPSSPSATSPSPTCYGYNTMGGYIVQLLFWQIPPTATVYYQVQPKGTPASGTWLICPLWTTWAGNDGVFGPVPPFAHGSTTLYAYVHEAGKTDSAIVHWNL
jgi:hypothetical protein